VSNLLQDIRFALRMLRKNRLATLVSVLTLALGIGANTAIFSVAEGFLVHPVPLPNVERLAAINNARSHEQIELSGVAPATYFDWLGQTKSFDELAAYQWDEINLTGTTSPQKVQAFAVTFNFFHLVGVAPAMGRAFLPDEEQPGQDRAVILSRGLWERTYGSDPNILNRQVKVDGLPYTVVGVMDKGFDFPLPAEAWVPLALSTEQRKNRDSRSLHAIAHLRPGVTFSSASAEMQTIFKQQAAAYPDSYNGWHIDVRSLADFTVGDLNRQYTLLFLGAVGFVLLIACFNIANIQFARMTSRAKELAVRKTLGSSRWRIVRQLLTESILLALGGAVAGLGLAYWEIQLMVNNMPADVAKFIAGWKTIHLDSGAFLYTLVIAVACGVVSGIAPALLSSHATLGDTLKETGRGSSVGAKRHRLRNALVVAEIALALVLLVGSGLLVKNFRGLLAVNNNFAPQTMLTMNLQLPDAEYPSPTTRLAFHAQALERLAALPGVESAGLVTKVPFADGGGASRWNFQIEGRAPAGREEVVSAIIETASPNYTSMLHIELLDGRELAATDRAETLPVCLVSQSLVRRYFQGQNPLHHRIRVAGAAQDSANSWMTVVGVVRDVRYSWINKDVIPTVYRSFRQFPRSYTTLLVRTRGQDPSQLAPAVREAIAAVDPNIPLYNLKPFDRIIIESIIGMAYVATIMAILGFIALVLASVGVYGVMSYAVSERTHEIGIRMSLGAETGDILSLVLRNGLLLTAIGLIIGFPVAFLMARALSGLFFGVDASDPAALAGIPLLLAAVAVLACYIPAVRASRVDPLQALRYQ
jgi:putative ABC transport system permease protein